MPGPEALCIFGIDYLRRDISKTQKSPFPVAGSSSSCLSLAWCCGLARGQLGSAGECWRALWLKVAEEWGRPADLFPGQGQLLWRSSFQTAHRASSMVAWAPSSAALGEMPAGVSTDFLGIPAGKTPVRLSKPQVKSSPSPRGNLGAPCITPTFRDGRSCGNTA